MLLCSPTGSALVSAANRLLWVSRASDDRDDDGRLTAGQIAGIAVAVIVCGVAIAVAVTFIYVKRRDCVKQRQPTTTAAP